MDADVNHAIERLIAGLDDDTLTHMFAALTFEMARRDHVTPRKIIEAAFKVAPDDDSFMRLYDML